MAELCKQNSVALHRRLQLAVGASAEQAGSWHFGSGLIRESVVLKDLNSCSSRAVSIGSHSGKHSTEKIALALPEISVLHITKPHSQQMVQVEPLGWHASD